MGTVPLAMDEEAWNWRIEDFFVSCQSEIYDDAHSTRDNAHADSTTQIRKITNYR